MNAKLKCLLAIPLKSPSPGRLCWCVCDSSVRFPDAFCAIILCSLLWDLLTLMAGKPNFCLTLYKASNPWPRRCSHRIAVLRTEMVHFCFQVWSAAQQWLYSQDKTPQFNQTVNRVTVLGFFCLSCFQLLVSHGPDSYLAALNVKLWT